MKSIHLLTLAILTLSCLLALAPATQPVAKPKIVTTQEWGSSPQPIPDSRKHTPKFITIHHAGTEWKKGKDPQQFVKTMQGWGQKEKKWPDLPYHFMIAPDGRIFEGRALIYEPESNTRYDLQGNVGVELMGNFEIQRPSPQQLESCAKLVAWLCQEYQIPLDQIRGHRDAAQNQTVCPGRDFYRYLESGDFKKWIAALQQGEAPMIQPGPALDGGPTTQIATD
jgi:hypothetical protein